MIGVELEHFFARIFGNHSAKQSGHHRAIACTKHSVPFDSVEDSRRNRHWCYNGATGCGRCFAIAQSETSFAQLPYNASWEAAAGMIATGGSPSIVILACT